MLPEGYLILGALITALLYQLPKLVKKEEKKEEKHSTYCWAYCPVCSRPLGYIIPQKTDKVVD